MKPNDMVCHRAVVCHSSGFCLVRLLAEVPQQTGHAIFLTLIFLQGSVATCFRCTGIFIDNFCRNFTAECATGIHACLQVTK